MIDNTTTGSTALGLTEDDLFADPQPAQPAQTHITCRVCERMATVPITHVALLCPLCLLDMDVTRGRVKAWLESALEQLDANQTAWDAIRAASPAADRWPAIQDALIAVAEKRVTQQALDATWAKRKAEGGPLARLLTAYEGYAAECDRLSEVLAKLDAAQREINHVWLSEEL